MWTFLQPINLLRYLCVWRVNRAVVRLPKYLPTELSQVLGQIITDHLPTAQTKPWQKALAAGAANLSALAWPIEAVLLTYPGKSHYGPGEPILWELKLLGPQAEHSFFLEVILPAMEAAGQTSDSRWYQANSLWGRFDIDAIYVAHGPRWEPLVSGGRLNARYRATPLQWADGLDFSAPPPRTYRQLTWLTPFDLTEQAPTASSATAAAPTMQQLLDALLARMARLLPGKYTTPGDVWNMLNPDEQTSLWQAIAQTDAAPRRRSELEPAPKDGPGRWLGRQVFAPIPPLLLPYLELAAVLHLGGQTHLGCGTFTLT